MFLIEDESHAEPHEGTYSTLTEAIDELKVLASIPWNEPPNSAPCMNWENCGRSYEIIEYDASVNPWKELRRIPALGISSAGVVWHDELKKLL